MNLMYRSSRNNEIQVTASAAILQGLADDGGLFVPEHIPCLDKSLKELSFMNYQQVAYEVMKLFLTDFTETELKNCIANAYDTKFDDSTICPIQKYGDEYYLELFHGSTIAFKDMALSLLPHLITVAAKKNQCDKEIVILTATSGDTGKAALAGFSDVPGTRIMVFYPKNGVSRIQEKQMVTQKGSNVKVIGINGNFDDAQTGVKSIFGDKELKSRMEQNGYRFSSANSINIGRLVPQIVYYVYSYTRLLATNTISEGEQIRFVVPTGNFGNILAGYYAKCMGLPVKDLICASNENKVLFDFFSTGTYDRNRKFILTSSPSMDILISSNLERLIYNLCNQDSRLNSSFMSSLTQNGIYTITDEMKDKLESFSGGYATEKETADMIHDLYSTTGYVIDTHTAVAAAVNKKIKKGTSGTMKTVIVSTASPYKFCSSVLGALGEQTEGMDDFEMARLLEKKSHVAIPKAVSELESADVLHNTICDVNNMKKEVITFLGLDGE